MKDASLSPDSGGFEGGDKDGVPKSALFRASSEEYNYTVFLGKLEEDSKGWHYNFHIRNYRSQVDRANWHLRPPTQTNMFDYQWYFYDDVEIDGKRNDALVVKLTLAVPWPDLEAIEEPAFAQFISRAATLATSNPVGQNELFNRIGHDPEIKAAFKWLVENGKYGS